MKIALLGYGKMGKEIETLAHAAGHSVVLKTGSADAKGLGVPQLIKADVAIEFSQPEAAFDNVMRCFAAGLPVVCGTTGWNDRLAEARKQCLLQGGAFFYASNFSIGVNLFFKLNRMLASLMEAYPGYEPSMDELHHSAKKDAPSGTALTLARDLLGKSGKREILSRIVNEGEELIGKKDELCIRSFRKDNIPGTHIVRYRSEVDEISIQHEAYSRKGFASGALAAAEWIRGKKGVFGMDDLLTRP